ncbi:Caspase-2 [Schistosoma japonicum]|uniref:Caspase-2 n=2 Tax=Schistosoma japonicum TaxID=6182 RepID=A0A4Z2CRB9_SCHJA|nr:Caspase-2 [Schistosoma japonicum]
MEREHRDVIRKLRVYFVKNVSNLEEILDFLESEMIITENQRHSVLSGSTVAEKIRKFLDIIVRCGPLAYDKFKEALLKTNQKGICDVINETEELKKSVGCNISSECTPGNKDNYIMTPDRLSSHPLTPYTVTSFPRGYVLIINIEEYSRESGVSSRLGSSHDVTKLQLLFEDFMYSVAVIRNVNGENLIKVVREFARKPEHNNVHAAVLIILAHGLEHHIIASDGIHVSIDELVSCFTNKRCPLLAGKPKFILIQACRGEERNHNDSKMGDFLDSLPSNSREISLDPSSWLSLPHMSDCVIAYTTLPGFVSWRSETEGSWYVKVFVEVTRMHGHRLHMLELLTEVNNRLVSEASNYGIKQISQPVTTLTKPYYLSTLKA